MLRNILDWLAENPTNSHFINTLIWLGIIGVSTVLIMGWMSSGKR